MSEKCKKVVIVLCILVVILIAIIYLLYDCGILVTDHSASMTIERLHWNGKTYKIISGKYTEGKTIAKTSDSTHNIKEIKEDPSHNFVVVRSFTDQQLYVAEDYIVPEAGRVTAVYWNKGYIKDAEFIEVVSKIEEQKVESFRYETEGIYMHTDNQHMEELYFAYEDCPIATNFKGYMGMVDGEWVITTYIASEQSNEDGSPKSYPVGCYIIPDEYIGKIEKYFEN